MPPVFTKKRQLELIQESITELSREYEQLFWLWYNARWYIAWHWKRKMDKVWDQIEWCKSEIAYVNAYWEDD